MNISRKGGFVNTGARVTNSAVQSIPDSVTTAIGFDTERWDTSAMHDPVVNNTRLTCVAAGTYLIAGCVGNSAFAAPGNYSLLIRLNGATFIGSQQSLGVPAFSLPNISLATVYKLGVGDYVELMVNQTSSAANNTQIVANIRPEFMIQRVG